MRRPTDPALKDRADKLEKELQDMPLSRLAILALEHTFRDAYESREGSWGYWQAEMYHYALIERIVILERTITPIPLDRQL